MKLSYGRYLDDFKFLAKIISEIFVRNLSHLKAWMFGALDDLRSSWVCLKSETRKFTSRSKTKIILN